VVRAFEKQLDEEGLEVEEDEIVNGAKSNREANGDAGLVEKAMEGLGLAGRGKETKKRRKGKAALVDV
jgi:hypothetical protein